MRRRPQTPEARGEPAEPRPSGRAPPSRRGRRRVVEELLEYLARSLVDEPDEVSVESFEEDDGTLVLELHVAEDDAGKVIGRGGRTVAALRTVDEGRGGRATDSACSSTSSIDAS